MKSKSTELSTNRDEQFCHVFDDIPKEKNFGDSIVILTYQIKLEHLIQHGDTFPAYGIL